MVVGMACISGDYAMRFVCIASTHSSCLQRLHFLGVTRVSTLPQYEQAYMAFRAMVAEALLCSFGNTGIPGFTSSSG